VSGSIRHRFRALSCARSSTLPAILQALVVAACLAGVPRLARADGSLVTAARDVATGLGARPATLVVASPVTSDVVAPRGDELAVRMASLVAAALGGGAHALEHPSTLSVARARASAAKAGALVYLDVRVENGELRLTADAYPVVVNAWDRIRAPLPPPAAHTFVHVPVDAEVRSYLPPLHLERAHVARFAHDVGPVLAMACGDLDGKGGNNLVLVTAREVAWGYLAEGRFVVVRRAPASSIARRSPVPFREPFATAVLAPMGGTLYVGWGDRGGASMGKDLTRHASLTGFPVAADGVVACATPEPARGGFGTTLVDCADGKPLATGSAPGTADAWAALGLPGGGRIVASHEPLGALDLDVAGDALVVNDVGAQLALADLDQDGVPEVITTGARGEDALVVSSWQKGGLAPRLRWAAPAGVGAVAICPAEAGDAPSLVAAIGSEIWLVR
jgi:hypothetical protein